jgi:hydroxypyruvate reductase
MADLAELRRSARRILDASIAAGDAGQLTREALQRDGRRLRVGGRTFDLDRVERILVVGAGKASERMAEAVGAVLPDVRLEGLVAVKERRGSGPPGIRIVESGHPIPDARGEAASAEILRIAGEAGPRTSSSVSSPAVDPRSRRRRFPGSRSRRSRR